MFRLSAFRIVLSFVSLTVIAGFLIPKIVFELNPSTGSDQIRITYTYNANSPLIVENNVTSIIENACSTLTLVKDIQSKSEYNSGYVALQFNGDANLEVKRFELSSIIRQIFPKLPPGCSYPIIRGGNEKEKSPILEFTVSASLQQQEITNTIEHVLLKNLYANPDIAEIKLTKDEPAQILIRLDEDKCRILQLKADEIINAIRFHYEDLFIGSISENNSKEIFVRIPGPYVTVSNLRNIPVRSSAGVFQIRDVAEVYPEQNNPTDYFRINGKNSIAVSIYGHPFINEIALAQSVKRSVSSLSKHLPPSYDLRITQDASEQVLIEFDKNKKRILFSTIFLVVILYLSSYSVRHILVLLTGMCINIGISIMLAYLFKVQFNFYSIAGINVALGVMIENILMVMEHFRMAKNKVFPPLLCTSLLFISGLSTMFLVNSDWTPYLTNLVVFVILTTVSSLLVAVFFIPGLQELTGTFQKKRSGYTYIKKKRLVKLINFYTIIIDQASGRKYLCITVLVLAFGIPFFLLPESWEGNRWYHNWYNKTIGSEHYQENIRPFIDKTTGGALRLFMLEVQGNASYRNTQKKSLTLVAELPPEHSENQMNELLSHFEKYLSNFTEHEIDRYITRINGEEYGSIEIFFKTGFEQSDFSYALRSALIRKTLEWSNVSWQLFGVGETFSNADRKDIPNYKIRLTGYNYNEVDKLATTLAQRLMKNQRVKYVNTNAHFDINEKDGVDYNMVFDVRKLSERAIDKIDLLNEINKQSFEVTGPYLRDSGSKRPVSISLKKVKVMHGTASFYDLFNDAILLGKGRQAELRSVAVLQTKNRISNILKDNRQYVRLISYDYLGSQQLGDQYLEEIVNEVNSQLPPGFTVKNDRSIKEEGSKPGRWLLSLLVFILITFLYSSILFESLRYPLLVLTMLPVSLIGIFIAFVKGNFYFDQGGYTSFFLVTGFVFNSTIFIINGLINRGQGLKKTTQRSFNKNVVKVLASRLKLTLVTALSTCCGLLPFVFEGKNGIFWFALATGGISGLLVSLLAIFVVLPILLWKTNKAKF